jgi:hypothetical protein
MTPEEYGLWYYCRCVSKKSSTVYLSGREIAKEFEGISKNVIYRIGDSLTAKGWFRDLAPYHRNDKTGTLVPRTVYALSHDEWTAKYSDIGCRLSKSPVPKSGQDHQAPVPFSGPPVPIAGRSCPDSRTDLSRNQEQRIKEVEIKEKRERRGAEPAPSPVSSRLDRQPKQDDLTGVIQQQAKTTAPDASFSGKSLTALRAVCDTSDFAELEVREAVEFRMRQMDEFQRMNAGSNIAANLASDVSEIRRRREDAQKTAEMVRLCTENEQKKAAEETAERLRKAEEEELLVEDELPTEIFSEPFCTENG